MTRVTVINDNGAEVIGWLHVMPTVPRYCARAAINVGEVTE